MLALAGGVLYLFDPAHFIPFTGGLVVLGAWLVVYYRAHVSDLDDKGEPNVGLVVPLLNVHAYLLGAVALALPPWIAVAMTVTSVLLLTSRDQLHALARWLEVKEIVTAGQFLILTGIVLPLLPNHPVTTWTAITPRQVWLALVVVCTFSYVSYLAQRYWAAAAGGLWMAALGGLYSSTATTVILARQAKAEPALGGTAQAGITLATAIMYLRILAVIAIFNLVLARQLALAAWRPVACCIFDLRAAISVPESRHRTNRKRRPRRHRSAEIRWSLVRRWSLRCCSSSSRWFRAGQRRSSAPPASIRSPRLSAVSDIDPFVLNLAQGGITGVTNTALTAAVLIAASSNNILKAIYAVSFGGGKATATSAAVLVVLACAGVAIALATVML